MNEALANPAPIAADAMPVLLTTVDPQHRADVVACVDKAVFFANPSGTGGRFDLTFKRNVPVPQLVKVGLVLVPLIRSEFGVEPLWANN